MNSQKVMVRAKKMVVPMYVYSSSLLTYSSYPARNLALTPLVRIKVRNGNTSLTTKKTQTSLPYFLRLMTIKAMATIM